MRYTIEDLTQGRVAVKNDGTVRELRDLLSQAFPKDYCYTSCDMSYYYANDDGSGWLATTDTTLPAQSVRDFLKSEQESQSDDDIEYQIVITKKKDGGFTVHTEGIEDIEALGALRFAEKYHWFQLVNDFENQKTKNQ